jgi:hypothetical protein
MCNEIPQNWISVHSFTLMISSVSSHRFPSAVVSASVTLSTKTYHVFMRACLAFGPTSGLTDLPPHDRHNIRGTHRTRDSQAALGRIHELTSTVNHIDPCITSIPIWKIPSTLHSGHRISLHLHTTINFRTIYRTTTPSHLR